jgi:hypothetical protein
LLRERHFGDAGTRIIWQDMELTASPELRRSTISIQRSVLVEDERALAFPTFMRLRGKSADRKVAVTGFLRPCQAGGTCDLNAPA